MPKLPLAFYQDSDVNSLAIKLLGKVLYTQVGDNITSGIIVETEAYKGVEDQASHAFGGRFTSRTQTMYEPGGVSYVYLCYGIHHLFNVVTAPAGIPHAVLVRGIEPLTGLDVMLSRRKMSTLKANLTAGPGALAMAMGIDRTLNGKDLLGDEIWIADEGQLLDRPEIVSCPRVGVDYAGEHALLPWRYYIKGNRFVSKPTG
jgi:DNA-3-methyladenine glycosylase